MTKSRFGKCYCGHTKGKLDLSESTIKDENESITWKQNVGNYFNEFCSSGTVHGIRYFSENRTTIEKIWWFVSMTVSLYFCVELIRATYVKWDTSPIIVSFATKETPVWMVPFPTVTICPKAKVRPSIFNYTKYLKLKKENSSFVDDTAERHFGYLSFLCDDNHHLNYNTSMDLYADDDIFDFYERIQPKFFETIHDCKFLGEKYNCSDLFVPLITDDGICYTFNLIDRSFLFSDVVVHYKAYHTAPLTHDWSLEHGYTKKAGVYAYPHRALFSGVPSALQLKLTVYEDDLDESCGDSMKGFKVQISHPQRIPRVNQQHFVVSLDRVSKAAIAPDMMTTSASVQNYLPKRRNCHLPSERTLKYFKVYSQNNCQIECTANYTLGKCGCVEFYMPRENSTEICNVGSLKCLKRAKHDMKFQMVQRKVREHNGEIIKDGENDLLNCACLPICTSMYYNVEYSQAPWKKQQKSDTNNTNLQKTKHHVSMLQVFFKGNQFITSERNELYGSTDFFANVGGLLGLFIGFSALSFIEIIYYLTLRIACNVAMFGKKNWAGKVN